MFQGHDAITALVALGFVVFFIYRQFAVRRIRPWSLVALPLIALWGASQQLHGGGLPIGVLDVALAVVGLASAVVFGVLRGAAMEVWRDAQGTIWARGSRLLLALWVASFAARIGLLAAGSWLGAGSSTAETLVFAAATLAAQNVVIWLKSGASAGAPALRRA